MTITKVSVLLYVRVKKHERESRPLGKLYILNHIG